MAKARPQTPQTITWLPWWLRGSVLRALLLLLAIAVVIGSLIVLGRWALEHLQGEERYQVPFGDIVVDPPAGLEREAFLDEVRFHAALPDRPLNVLDKELKDRLEQAFARHPWVTKVNKVTVESPKRIEVALTYRRPVLAVKWEGVLRAVDGDGVLLPKAAPTKDLPLYEGDPQPPKGPPGTPWGDPEIERQARKLRE